MLKSLNESLVTVIALNGKDDQPSNVGMIYKSLDKVIEDLKSYRFVEEITINRDTNIKPLHGVYITCNDPNVTVNGKPFFLTIHDALLIGTAKYTVISVDGAIATFDDADECVEYHLTKRNELLGKILS
nr:MAG TPA: hypothetical protein [Caudoviricetes sp.]